MESCRGKKLPELRASDEKRGATGGDILLWREDVQTYTDDCFQRHDNLIQWVKKKLGMEEPKKNEPEVPKSFWDRLLGK